MDRAAAIPSTSTSGARAWLERLSTGPEPPVDGIASRFALYVAGLIAATGIATPLLCLFQQQTAWFAREALASLAVALALVELGFVIRSRNRIAAVRPLRYILAPAAFFTALSFVLLFDGFPRVAGYYAAASAVVVVCYAVATDERHHLREVLAEARRQSQLLALERQVSALRLQGHTVILVTLTAVLQKAVREARLKGKYEVLGNLLDELTAMTRVLEASVEDAASGGPARSASDQPAR